MVAFEPKPEWRKDTGVVNNFQLLGTYQNMNYWRSIPVSINSTQNCFTSYRTVPHPTIPLSALFWFFVDTKTMVTALFEPNKLEVIVENWEIYISNCLGLWYVPVWTGTYRTNLSYGISKSSKKETRKNDYWLLPVLLLVVLLVSIISIHSCFRTRTRTRTIPYRTAQYSTVQYLSIVGTGLLPRRYYQTMVAFDETTTGSRVIVEDWEMCEFWIAW